MKILVNIDVPELAAGVEFYTTALDLQHTRTLDADVAELVNDTMRIYLLRNPPGSRASSRSAIARRYDRHWTPVHVDFVVDDLEAAAKRALSAGAVQESELVEWRGSRCVTFSDPFGHGFCLITFDQQTYVS